MLTREEKAKKAALERWLKNLRDEYPEVYVAKSPVYREYEALLAKERQP